MVSMVEASSHSTCNFNNDPSMDPIVTKPEIPEGSVDSSVSDPEAEAEVEVLTQDISQTQKRKGGRKPVRKMSFCCSSLFLIGFPLLFSFSFSFSFLPFWLV